jgi:hypothetical protein
MNHMMDFLEGIRKKSSGNINDKKEITRILKDTKNSTSDEIIKLRKEIKHEMSKWDKITKQRKNREKKNKEVLELLSEEEIW